MFVALALIIVLIMAFMSKKNGYWTSSSVVNPSKNKTTATRVRSSSKKYPTFIDVFFGKHPPASIKVFFDKRSPQNNSLQLIKRIQSSNSVVLGAFIGAFVAFFVVSISFYGIRFFQSTNINNYPESIRNCYNNIVYENKNKCKSSKRSIINYCECVQNAQALIASKEALFNQYAYIEAKPYLDRWTPESYATLTILPARGVYEYYGGKLQEYANELYDQCAKDTNYKKCY